MEDIKKTWDTDHNLRQLIADLTKDANSHSNYSWVNNTLIRKGKVVVGQAPNLQHQLIKLYHDSAVGGHSGATITSKKIRAGVLLEETPKAGEAIRQGMPNLSTEQG